MGKEAKTNAMRMLDRKKVKYEALAYDCGEFIDGIHCADITGALMISPLRPWSWKGKRRLLCVCSSDRERGGP